MKETQRIAQDFRTKIAGSVFANEQRTTLINVIDDVVSGLTFPQSLNQRSITKLEETLNLARMVGDDNKAYFTPSQEYSDASYRLRRLLRMRGYRTEKNRALERAQAVFDKYARKD